MLGDLQGDVDALETLIEVVDVCAVIMVGVVLEPDYRGCVTFEVVWLGDSYVEVTGDALLDYSIW